MSNMRVILLDKIDKLGNIGMEITVKSGYARNFLIPQAKAILANKKNIEVFRAQQLALKSEFLKKKEKAEFCAGVIRKLSSITIPARAGIEGKLFGSIGARDIARVITEVSGVEISKSQIRLPNRGALRTTGMYIVDVHIYSEIFVPLNVLILDKLSNIKK